MSSKLLRIIPGREMVKGRTLGQVLVPENTRSVPQSTGNNKPGQLDFSFSGTLACPMVSEDCPPMPSGRLKNTVPYKKGL